MIKVRRIYVTRGDGVVEPTTRVKVFNLKVEERELHEADSRCRAVIAKAQAKFDAQRISPESLERWAPKPVGPPSRIMRDPGPFHPAPFYAAIVFAIVVTLVLIAST